MRLDLIPSVLLLILSVVVLIYAVKVQYENNDMTTIKKVFTAIRWFLSGFLIYNTYLEAGVYTAICFTLILAGVESRKK